MRREGRNKEELAFPWRITAAFSEELLPQKSLQLWKEDMQKGQTVETFFPNFSLKLVYWFNQRLQLKKEKNEFL